MSRTDKIQVRILVENKQNKARFSSLPRFFMRVLEFYESIEFVSIKKSKPNVFEVLSLFRFTSKSTNLFKHTMSDFFNDQQPASMTFFKLMVSIVK